MGAHRSQSRTPLFDIDLENTANTIGGRSSLDPPLGPARELPSNLHFGELPDEVSGYDSEDADSSRLPASSALQRQYSGFT